MICNPNPNPNSNSNSIRLTDDVILTVSSIGGVVGSVIGAVIALVKNSSGNK